MSSLPAAPPRREEEEAAGPPPRLPVSAVALSAAAGVLVVASAFTAGHLGHAGSPWANWVFWLGEALILIPVAARLLSRRAGTAGQTLAVVVVLTVAEYLVKVCYSPAMFGYVDELQHWRSAANILQTGRLTTVNYGLPISPHYPGLEEVTTALASLTGLSLFTSGLIVAGIAYLLFACALFLLFREISGSHRIAGMALLVYASSREFHYDNALFIYETLALAFFAIALFAAWRLMSPPPPGARAGWIVTATVAILATVVTHHVTSYMLTVTLVIIALASLVTGHRRAAAWPAGLALLTSAAAATWLVLMAPGTAGYLWPVVSGTWQGFQDVLAGRSGGAPSVTSIPLGNLGLGLLAIGLLSLLLLAGTWELWRRYRHGPWTLAMALGPVGWFADIAVRLTNPSGSEFAGRGVTFVMIPASYVAALALARLTGSGWQPRVLARLAGAHWLPRALAATALAAVLIMMWDGQANGWPPYWERLPGPYQVAGAERSMAPVNIAAARWALGTLGPGRRFASDWGNTQILGTYGNQIVVYENGFLFTSPALRLPDTQLAREERVRYLLLDWRLTRALPASGSYFQEDIENGRIYPNRLVPAGLAKFSHITGVSRLYDSGTIVIYDLKGSPYAP